MKKINISNINALQFFQLARYGTLLLIGILFSKSEFGKTNIGHYEIFLLIAGAFTFFWVNGLLKALLPLSAEKGKESRPILIFNAFLVLLAFSLLSSILFLVCNQPFSNLLLNGNEVPMPFLLALYIFINSPALIVEYVYLANNRAKSILVYAIVSFSLMIAAVGVPPYLGLGLNYVLTGLLMISILRFSWLLFVLKKYSKAEFNWPIIKEFLIVGAPLVLSTFLSSSASYIDGFIVSSQFSLDDLAVFKYGARELPLALILANSLSLAMLPQFAQKNIDSPLAELRSETLRLSWLLFPLSIVLLLTSHWLFPLVFNAQFEGSATIFNIYILLIISRLLFPQTILTAKRANRILVQASLFEIIINVSASIFLASKIGIAGVAYGTFIAYFFEKIYLIIACKKQLGINLTQYVPTRIYFIFSFVTAITFVFVEYLIY